MNTNGMRQGISLSEESSLNRKYPKGTKEPQGETASSTSSSSRSTIHPSDSSNAQYYEDQQLPEANTVSLEIPYAQWGTLFALIALFLYLIKSNKARPSTLRRTQAGKYPQIDDDWIDDYSNPHTVKQKAKQKRKQKRSPTPASASTAARKDNVSRSAGSAYSSPRAIRTEDEVSRDEALKLSMAGDKGGEQDEEWITVSARKKRTKPAEEKVSVGELQRTSPVFLTP